MALVAQEPIEDVLTQRFGNEFGGLHHLQRIGQRLGQLVDAHLCEVGIVHLEKVRARFWWEFVSFADSLHAGSQDDGEGQIRVACGVR